MLARSTAWKRTRWIVSCGLLALLTGCATASKQELIPMFWPGPPDVTRIKFVRAFASEADLGRETTAGESLEFFLTGRRPPIWHLANPLGVAVSDDGQRVYVSDYVQALVYVFDFPAKEVTLLGQNDKLFDRPVGIALDEKENLYVVDSVARTVVILDRHGRRQGKIVDQSLERPTGIAIDRERGKIYVADTSHQLSKNHYIHVYNLQGRPLGKIGLGKGADEGAFLFPTYLAVDSDGKLYVSDTMNARIQVFSPDGQYLDTIGARGNAPGTFARPKGVAVDTFGNVYVVDSDWANVQIFNPKGQALLFFGGRGRYPGLLNTPAGIAIDRENKIYVADTQNLRVDVYQLVNTTAEDSFSQSEVKEHVANRSGGTKGGDGNRGSETTVATTSSENSNH
jgi:DNA-binding beta-propeller fold protein YncE